MKGVAKHSLPEHLVGLMQDGIFNLDLYFGT